jgi:hypothetical protein
VKSLLKNRWLRTGHRPVLARRGRPSPAMVIALIALFVSLSGVSYGVATGFIDSREIKNNEVRSLDIRNNEVRSKDIRNNEVRGRDIRNSTIQSRDIAINAVTGDDVKEETLAKVPSALLADRAASAAGVDTLKIIPETSLAEGAPDVTLATHGPLTLLGRCEPNASSTEAGLLVGTTEDNSAAGGGTSPEPDLDTGASPFLVDSLQGPAGAPRSVGLTQVFASAPSGKSFTGQVVMYADATGSGSCMFHGHLALEG